MGERHPEFSLNQSFMKPYFAVLYDSFLESTRSYVLWILLLAWTLLLAVLFPLSFVSAESYQFMITSFRGESSPASIMDSLAEASAGKGSKMQRAILEEMGEPFRKLMKERKDSKRRVSVGLLLDELNKLLKVKDLYVAETWPNLSKSDKWKELIEKSSLTETEQEKLNRKLIDSSFPGTFSSPEGRATWVSYAGIKLGNPLPFSKEAARPFIEQAFYPIIMWIGLSIVMLFVAIIITSPLIPDIFQPGSLHLLLSKPISRSLLFLTKFLGGCIFVSLNVSFVLLGLYLYSGLRLEIWNEGILKCIPLFIFSFLVYYSVSCLAGLIWKNAIISVVVTALFWALCFVLGIVYSYFRHAVEVQPTLRSVYSVGDSLWAVSQNGSMLLWDKKTNGWSSGFGDRDDQRFLGPVAIQQSKAIYFARTENIPFGFAIRDSMRIEMARIPEIFDPADTTYETPPWADSRLDSGPTMPSAAESIIPWKDTLAVTSAQGIFVFDPSKERETENKFEGISNVLKSLGVNAKAKSESAFKAMIEGLDLNRPFDWAVSPSFDTIAAYSKGELIVWKRAEDTYRETGRTTFDFDKELVVVLGCHDGQAIVAPEGLTPIMVRLDEGMSKSNVNQVGPSRIRQIALTPKGEFLVIDYEGNLWRVNAEVTEVTKPNLTGQGEALAVHMIDDDHLWLAFGVRSVAQWDLAKNSVVDVRQPGLRFPEFLHYYVIRPMYWIAQRPAEMEDLGEILGQNSKKGFGNSRRDLDMTVRKKETKSSVLSNLVFIVVVLSVCCIYMYRQDL
jgi:ABC-type transport system involved in multi-copper enzyme maturation permease subunit